MRVLYPATYMHLYQTKPTGPGEGVLSGEVAGAFSTPQSGPILLVWSERADDFVSIPADLCRPVQ